MIYQAGKKYGAVSIDPPWRFITHSGGKVPARAESSQYPTLTIEEMRKLDIASVMADDSVLHMWATMPTLPEAIDLGRSWGLKYSTVGFVWIKTYPSVIGRFVEILDTANWFMGMGYWTRSNAELCLLFTKGSPKRVSKGVRQVIIAPSYKHSQKPKEIYSRIMQLTEGDYLEIFAREHYPGWYALGNELEGDGRDIRDVLPQREVVSLK